MSIALLAAVVVDHCHTIGVAVQEADDVQGSGDGDGKEAFSFSGEQGAAAGQRA
ncbi:MAG: hypothetical protein OXN89_23030 [Bryobacterales bacterium]|nr:hypothetical protein [Bryobacterales bacterium]